MIIADVFSDEDETLYNSVSYNKADLDELLLNIHSLIENDIERISQHLLSCDDVSSALSMLDVVNVLGMGFYILITLSMVLNGLVYS